MLYFTFFFFPFFAYFFFFDMMTYFICKDIISLKPRETWCHVTELLMFVQ